MTINDNLSKRHRGILELLTLDTAIKIPELGEQLGRFYARVVFFGADGFSPEYGLSIFS